MFENSLGNVHFRRTLIGDARELWEHIKEVCSSVTLNDDKDEVKCTLTKKGVYTVKSFYRHLIENGIKYLHLYMWKIKMPPRIKVFMWLALRNSILTKDNLLRRGWKGDDRCPFCGRKENINHLFLSFSVARLLWNILKCAFNLRNIPENLDVIMKTWVKTFGKDEKGLVMIGISAIAGLFGS